MQGEIVLQVSLTILNVSSLTHCNVATGRYLYFNHKLNTTPVVAFLPGIYAM